MLKALVIVPNDKPLDEGDLLAIARAEAQKREGTHEKVRIPAIVFIPQLKVYVAVYEPGCSKGAGVSSRTTEQR